MTRIGVLGAGAHSSTHHGTALQHCQRERPEAVELAAVCDLDSSRADEYAGRFGFHKTYTDLDTMAAEEELDGLVCITPLELTSELITGALGLKIPLVIEKPPGHSLEVARQLRDVVVDSGVPHMVSFNRRFSPAFARAASWIADGGDARRPQRVISRMLRHNRREERFVFGTAIHSIDTVLAVMGQPLEVVTHADPVSAAETLFYDARLTFVDGGSATFLFAPACGHTEETVEIIGDDYDIQVDMGGCAVTIRERGDLVLTWSADDGAEQYESSGSLDETRAFILYLENGQDWWPTVEDALWSVRAADAIQRGVDGELKN